MGWSNSDWAQTGDGNADVAAVLLEANTPSTSTLPQITTPSQVTTPSPVVLGATLTPEPVISTISPVLIQPSVPISSSSTPAPGPAPMPSPSTSDTNTVIIVAGMIGGALFLAIIGACLCFYKSRIKTESEASRPPPAFGFDQQAGSRHFPARPTASAAGAPQAAAPYPGAPSSYVTAGSVPAATGARPPPPPYSEL